jgi:Raf kinase inhibitor-like YbhB/YbcL family protein
MMMTVMQWLAALAIVLGSLGAAVAQDTGSKSPAGPTILVPTPSSVAEPVSGGGPAPDVAAGPGHPRQPTIISSAFSDYGWLPLKYASNAAKMVTFDAISPPLAWTAPPAGTASIALIMIDMETSSGGNPQDRLLWAVVNLPPSTRLLAENTIRGRTAMLPAGAFQLSFLTNGYVGPLPGANIQAHHYLFELYTLDKMLDVPRDVTLDQLKAAIKGHQTGQRGVLVVKCCTDSK